MVRPMEAPHVVRLVGPLAPTQEGGEHATKLGTKFPALLQDVQALGLLRPLHGQLIKLWAPGEVLVLRWDDLEIAPEEAVASASTLPLGLDQRGATAQRLRHLPAWVNLHDDVLDDDAHPDAVRYSSSPKEVSYPGDFPEKP